VIDHLLKPVDWAKKTHNWLLDGDPRQSPVKKRWVSSSRERIQIVVIRGFSALYSLIYVILFQAYSILAEFVVGVFADTWRSDRRHTRDVVLTVVSVLSSIVQGIIGILVRIGQLLLGFFRE